MMSQRPSQASTKTIPGVTKIVHDNTGKFYPRNEIIQTTKHKIRLRTGADGVSKLNHGPRKIVRQDNMPVSIMRKPHSLPERSKINGNALNRRQSETRARLNHVHDYQKNTKQRTITEHKTGDGNHECACDDIENFCRMHGLCTCVDDHDISDAEESDMNGSKRVVKKWEYSKDKSKPKGILVPIGSKYYSTGERSRNQNKRSEDSNRCANLHGNTATIVELVSGQTSPTLDSINLSQYRVTGHRPWERPTASTRHAARSEQQNVISEALSRVNLDFGGMPFNQFSNDPHHEASERLRNTSSQNDSKRDLATRQAARKLVDRLFDEPATDNENMAQDIHHNENSHSQEYFRPTKLILLAFLIILIWLLILTIDPGGYFCNRCRKRSGKTDDYDGVFP